MRAGKRVYVSVWCLVLMVAGFAAVVFCAGDLSDDYWYRCEFVAPERPAGMSDADYYSLAYSGYEQCAGPEINSLNQVSNSFSNHWRYWNNARLSSLLMMLSNLVPGWLVDLLQVAAMALMALMLLRIAESDKWRQRPLLTALVLWGVWLIMPWYNQMLSTVYMMTYIWGTALMLSAVWCYQEGRKPYWAVCLLGFVAATMHEGITLPILCGVVVEAVVTRRWKRGAIFALCMAAGLVLITLNPSLFARMGWDNHGADSIARTLHFLLTRMWILPVAVVAIAVVCIKRGKVYAFDYLKSNALWLTCAAVSTLFGCYTGNFDRQVWVGELALLILLARLVPVKTDNQPSPGGRVLASLLGIGLFMWLCLIADYQLVGMKEFAQVEKEIVETHDTEPLYVDVREPYSLPWWLLEIPEMYQNQYPILRRNQRAFLSDNHPATDPVILPSTYKGQPFSTLPSISGNAGLRGCFPWYYSPTRLKMPYDKLTYTLQKGNKQVQVPLMTEEHAVVCNGDTAYFYRPTEWRRQDYGLKPISINK